MRWKIYTFETTRGKKTIDEFIEGQSPKTRAKIVQNIRLLKQYGNNLGMPHAKILGKGLYELRIRGKNETRIFYSFKGKSIYLLHAFKKKTQKTPRKELELALIRKNSLTNI